MLGHGIDAGLSPRRALPLPVLVDARVAGNRKDPGQYRFSRPVALTGKMNTKPAFLKKVFDQTRIAGQGVIISRKDRVYRGYQLRRRCLIGHLVPAHEQHQPFRKGALAFRPFCRRVQQPFRVAHSTSTPFQPQQCSL